MIKVEFYAEVILRMRPANERWCYSVTPSLIGWAHTENDPCLWEEGGNINLTHCGLVMYATCMHVLHMLLN